MSCYEYLFWTNLLIDAVLLLGILTAAYCGYQVIHRTEMIKLRSTTEHQFGIINQLESENQKLQQRFLFQKRRAENNEERIREVKQAYATWCKELKDESFQENFLGQYPSAQQMRKFFHDGLDTVNEVVSQDYQCSLSKRSTI